MIRPLLLAAWCAGLVLQAQAPRDTRPVVTSAGTASITGVVVSDEAAPKPLRRAMVTLNGSALPIGRTVITGDDGTFGFSGLPAGRYALGATKGAYVAIKSGSARPAPIAERSLPPAGLSLSDGESRRVTLRLPRGAVLSGMVTDGDGQPVQGAMIVPFADRFNTQTGQRLLWVAGPQVATDDRGMYRIYGLPAGEYVVEGRPPGPIGGLPSGDTRLTTSTSRSVVAVPVFFPSATDVSRASRVTVAAGEERDGLDIQMQAVPAATISGTVPVNPEVPVFVLLIRTNDPATERMQSTGVARDGQFVFTGVAPGRYTMVARGQSPPPPGGLGPTPAGFVFGSADVVVDGEDVSNISIPMAPALAISGKVVFEGTTSPLALPSLRLPLPVSTNLAFGLSPSLQMLEGGRFTISGLAPVAYRLSYANVPGIRASIAGWWLKSIAIDGREVLDSVLDVRQGSDNAVITLSDQASEISGTLKDARGAPVPDAYVVAFSADRAAWFFGSRRVAGVHPDRQGHYAIRNLPPGEYRMFATGDLDPGEWFDPTVLESLMPTASVVRVAGVETITRDLTIR